MTVRNLEFAFSPRSLVVVGASPKAASVGRTVTANVRGAGFAGPIHLVNPHHAEIDGLPCLPDVAALPEPADLAVVATPSATVPGIIDALGKRGTRAAVVITAGFDAATRQAMLDASKPYCLRVIGPNCLGIWVPPLRLNASFGHIAPAPGRLAFLSQSGALAGGVLDWAAARRIGFSAVVSMGDMADVDAGDLLDFFAADVSTHAILLYLETVTEARKFMSAARSAARAKPVVLIKSGRFEASAQAAATHTGALAGGDNVADAALRRAGLLRVDELEELFAAAETLTWLTPVENDRLTILTNGGGAGVLAVDQLMHLGGRLSGLSKRARGRLDAVLPANWSKANPVDIIGDASPERYRAALDILLDETDGNAILVMNCPTALTSSSEAAKAVVDTIVRRRGKGAVKPILCNWLGGEGAAEARRLFAEAGIPSFESPDDAVRGFRYLWDYTRAREALARTPPREVGALRVDREKALAAMRPAAQAGRTMLSEPEAKAVLAAYGIAVVATEIAASPEEVRTAAARLLAGHHAVVVKVLSDDISHKSDVGGVVLGIETAAAAEAAAAAMSKRIARLLPEARIGGFTVQPMIERPGAHELLLGLSEDPLFGPIVLFGAGGTAAELLRDTAVALPPLDTKLAGDLVRETRIHRLLEGYRDRAAADLDAIVDALVRLSQLVVDIPAIRELDINPLLADDKGVIALDARVRIAPAETAVAGPNPRLAIRPYPNQWEAWVADNQGRRVFIRPIRPADEHLYGDFIARLTPEDIRFRFLAPRKEFSHQFIARFTQIDYARAMAFIALNEVQDELLGIVRLSADADYRTAEFAIIVRSDLKGRGLGWRLMRHLIAYAGSEGLQELTGQVLATNIKMLAMGERLGFDVHKSDDPGLCEIVLALPVPDRTLARQDVAD